MTYVDGFVIPVPKNKVAAYRKMARQGADLWMKYGALDYKECVADDLNSFGPDGKRVPSLFPKLARAKKTETVFFSYIVYKSKAHRNSVNKKVMSDPSMAGMDLNDMPFDLKRMAYAGFKPVVEASAKGHGGSRGEQRTRPTAAAGRDRTRTIAAAT